MEVRLSRCVVAFCSNLEDMGAEKTVSKNEKTGVVSAIRSTVDGFSEGFIPKRSAAHPPVTARGRMESFRVVYLQKLSPSTW